jgi:hypothetical protein
LPIEQPESDNDDSEHGEVMKPFFSSLCFYQEKVVDIVLEGE